MEYAFTVELFIELVGHVLATPVCAKDFDAPLSMLFTDSFTQAVLSKTLPTSYAW